MMLKLYAQTVCSNCVLIVCKSCLLKIVFAKQFAK